MEVTSRQNSSEGRRLVDAQNHPINESSAEQEEEELKLLDYFKVRVYTKPTYPNLHLLLISRCCLCAIFLLFRKEPCFKCRCVLSVWHSTDLSSGSSMGGGGIAAVDGGSVRECSEAFKLKKSKSELRLWAEMPEFAGLGGNGTGVVSASNSGINAGSGGTRSN